MTTDLIFTINRISAAPTRRETIAGTEYLVVPVVALVPGVLNSELVEASSIVPEDWNGVPVTIGHPQANGEFISARQPHIETLNPARLYNARLDSGSLKADIYINIAQAAAIGGDVAEAVKRFEAGQVVNVSTGYFRDTEPTAGVLNGKAYTSIAHNIRPDQLAILLNEDGACSISDGCGAPRVNREEGRLRINVELSLDERMSQVYDAWHKKFEGPDGSMSVYVREVFDDFVIARSDKGGLWAYPYARNEDNSIAFDQPFEVVIAYQNKESGMQINKWLSRIAEHLGIKTETTMNEKEKLIASLTANKRCKFDKEALGKFDEGQLKTLSESLAEPAAAAAPSTGSGQAQAPPPAQADPPAQPDKPQAVPPTQPDPPNALAQLTKTVGELKTVVEGLTGHVQANANQEKARLVEALVANKSIFTEAELNGFELPMLRKLAQQFTPPDYSGVGLPIQINAGDADWVEYEVPQPAQPTKNGGAK